ncbi:MAG: hypothetical protein KGO51_10250 [Alphaproteobacteria bacterium]|nr:hypothetical protein [Alphaproteobacteria bacterium]
MIAAGAAAEAQGALGKLCRLCGQLSYPIYIIHWPIVGLFSDWVWATRPPRAEALAVGAPVVLALPLLAWAALKLYDEPVRACIAGRRQVPQQTLAGVGEGARLAAGRARR